MTNLHHRIGDFPVQVPQVARRWESRIVSKPRFLSELGVRRNILTERFPGLLSPGARKLALVPMMETLFCPQESCRE